MPTVKLSANLGTNDVDRYSLPEGKTGDVLEVDDRQADILLGVLRCAEPCKPEPKVASLRSEVLAKEEAARQEIPDQPPAKRQPKAKSSPFNKES
jgi:hypothetical protein